MSKQKKKRRKQYRPKNSAPKVHRFVAEEEAKAQARKKFKRRMIVWGAILLVLLGLYSLFF